MKRLLIYLLAALVPPIGLGLAMALNTMSDAMIHLEPRPLPSATPGTEPGRAAKPRPYRAVILLSTSGTETLEALSAYEVLATSGAFDVKTAASTRALVRTTSDLAILPDLLLSDAKGGDLLIVPSMVDPSDVDILDYLSQNASRFTHLLVSGEGARLAARTLLLADKRATTHFLAAPDLANSKPEVHWVAGARTVRDDAIVTTAGLSATIDGALDSIGQIAGPRTAERTAASLGWSWKHDDVSSLGGKSWPTISPLQQWGSILRTGFDWDHPAVSVFVYPGVSEIGLAAALDILPRAYTLRVQTLSAGPAGEREVVTTRHGLRVVAARDLTAPPPTDLLLIPSSAAQVDPPALKKWVSANAIPVKNLSYDAPGSSLPETLDLLAQMKGSAVAALVAKIEQMPRPESSSASSTTLWVWLRPLLLAFLGVFLAWRIELSLSKRRV